MTITLYHDSCRWTIDIFDFFHTKTLTDGKKLLTYGFTDPLERNAVSLDTIREYFTGQVNELKTNIRALEDIGYLNRKQTNAMNHMKKEHAKWFKLLSFYDEMSKKYI